MFLLVSHGAVVTGPGEGAGVWCHDEDGGTTPPVVWISSSGKPWSGLNQPDSDKIIRGDVGTLHMGPCQFIIGSKVYSGAAFNLRRTVTLHREQLVSD